MILSNVEIKCRIFCGRRPQIAHSIANDNMLSSVGILLLMVRFDTIWIRWGHLHCVRFYAMLKYRKCIIYTSWRVLRTVLIRNVGATRCFWSKRQSFEKPFADFNLLNHRQRKLKSIPFEMNGAIFTTVHRDCSSKMLLSIWFNCSDRSYGANGLMKCAKLIQLNLNRNGRKAFCHSSCRRWIDEADL